MSININLTNKKTQCTKNIRRNFSFIIGMKKLIPFLFLVLFILSFSFSFAQQIEQPTGEVDTSFFNIWSGTGGATETSTCNMLGYTCTFCDALIVTANIIKFLLNIGIILAVVIILYAGIRFITAGGSEKQISGAKDTITKALIGLALVIGAWFIVSMVFSFLTNRDNWNEINPLNCPSSKLKVWDYDKDTNGTNNNQNNNQQNNNQNNSDKGFLGETTTPEELQNLANLNLTEGEEVAEIEVCKTHQTQKENILQYAFSTPKVAHAVGYRDSVINYASHYLGKLKYSNDAKARRDLDGETQQCKDLIRDTNYTGCADCSGFAFKIFACVLGEDIGKRIDDQTELINSSILATVNLPKEFQRYFTKDLTGSEIAYILTRGDIMGYDVTCNKKYNPGAKMGHVMIYTKQISGANGKSYIQMIDQGSDGGARKKNMSEAQKDPFVNCGYIIHIVNG